MNEFDQLKSMVNKARAQFGSNKEAYKYLNEPDYRRSIIQAANKSDPQLAQQVILKYLFILDQVKYSISDEWVSKTFEQFPQNDRRKWVKIYEYLYETDPLLPEVIFGAY